VLVPAGVWLIFLVSPIVSIVAGPASTGMTILGLAGTAAFIGVYLAHFVRPWRARGMPLWANTLVTTLLLLICVIATVPAAGLNAFTFLPFTLAIWIFPHSLRVGLPVSVALAATWVAAVLLVDAGDERFWMIAPVVLALIIMVALRLAMEREERSRILSEELALSRQREQMGRDVHDVLGHSLTVITLKTELARRLVDGDPERARAQLDEVLDVSRQALAEVRSAVGGRHVPDLGTQLASSRTALEAAGIAADLPGPASAASLPERRRELFAWCLREAVTNVIRHADASRCKVTLSGDRLTVVDDGVGLPAAVTGSEAVAGSAARVGAASASGSGLRGLRARVAEAGGTLVVEDAEPGAQRPGTRLEVRL
jgi:two-component system sensor histidine kinase DesK